jgi:signal transduction histidine kinase
MQVAWLDSAYTGELALIEKARNGFEAELRSDQGLDAESKRGLANLLLAYEKEGQLGQEQIDWFNYSFVPALELSPLRTKYAVYLDGVSIGVAQVTGTRQTGFSPIIADRIGSPEKSRMDKAARICINCMPGMAAGLRRDRTYQLLLFYREEGSVIFDRLGFLIIGSFIFLGVFGILFRQLMKKYRQEKRLSEAKNDFINNLSHELQTPVFAIQMANRIIKDKAASLPEMATLTQIIEKECRQLKSHSGKILELASLENGQVELSLELTELNAFVEERRQTIELLLQAKKGVLQTKFDALELYSDVDRVHLNNIVMTLVDNAIKYNENAPLLTIETGTAGAFVSLKVSDNGIGIRQQFLPYVSNKFFRVPGVNRSGIPGFGLGLSYVKNVVELHGGMIKLESEPGVGTTVTILLPKASTHV